MKGETSVNFSAVEHGTYVVYIFAFLWCTTHVIIIIMCFSRCYVSFQAKQLLFYNLMVIFRSFSYLPTSSTDSLFEIWLDEHCGNVTVHESGNCLINFMFLSPPVNPNPGS